MLINLVSFRSPKDKLGIGFASVIASKKLPATLSGVVEEPLYLIGGGFVAVGSDNLILILHFSYLVLTLSRELIGSFVRTMEHT
jgi:hypothetical protein